ncbi:T9SS type A sorting domain-containing protein [Flavobacterium sp.]|uniref:VPS10 domain-containing protein n=1 Tax=Flavobacterium sp. TaxID=239 RepID=UPI0026304346|nr:T9SS type A sorting domain-containing protein [Flavobacterium sp.]
MKNFILTALLMLACYTGNAQYSFEAVDDYGRLEGLNYDLLVEDKVYAVTLKNHVVVSYDNAQTWDLLYTFPDSRARITNLKTLPGGETLAFTVIELDAAQNGFYVLSIEDAEIINFISLPVPEENPSVNNFDIYDAEGNTMILNVSALNGYKVFYTTTGGESWTEVYAQADYNNVSVSDVAISPADPNKLFIARGLGPDGIDGGMFISADAGETWSETLAGTPLSSIDFNPTDADDLFTGTSQSFGDGVQNLYRSYDGGETWDIMPVEWSEAQFDYITVVRFHPNTPTVMYALETNEIAYSEDGGTTWTSTEYTEDEYYGGLSITINPFDGKEALIVANMYPARTTNGGASLTQVKAPFYAIRGIAATKFNGTEHLYYAAQGGLVHKNYNTNTSNSYDIEPPSSFSLSDYQLYADENVEGRLYLYEGGFMGSSLYISEDYGATKTQLMSEFSPNFTGVASDPENTNIIYYALSNFDNLSTLYRLDISDMENLNPEMLTLPEEGFTGSILTTASETENALIITLGSKVYRSTDEGTTWTEIFSVEEGELFSVVKNPFDDNSFAVASSNGIYTTTDGGENWDMLLEGIAARKIKYSDTDNGVIAAGIYNSEAVNAAVMYYNGNGWITVTPAELNYLHSYTMDFNFADDTINAYIGTVDAGVIRYSFEVGELGTDNPVKTASKLTVYPNPASDVVTISIDNAPAASVAVYSLTGQKVLQGSTGQLNIASLSAGMYLIKAETAEGKSASQKLIKK